MKAFLTKNGTAHIEVTFNELTELCVALQTHVRGPAAGKRWIYEISQRLGNMWDCMMNGQKPTRVAPPQKGHPDDYGKAPLASPKPDKLDPDSPQASSAVG